MRFLCRFLRTWLLWWLGLACIYWLFTSKVTWPEVFAGSVAAALAATGTVVSCRDREAPL